MPNAPVELTAEWRPRIGGLEEVSHQTADGNFENASQGFEPVWAFSFGSDLVEDGHNLGVSTDEMQHLFGISSFDDDIDFDWT